MSEDVPGIDDKFRLPRADKDQNLLNVARGFLTDAQPLSAQFIAHELPANFVSDLIADIEAFEIAMTTQTSGLGQRMAAGAAIDEAIDSGRSIVRKLDAIVKNKYAHNAAVLAQWTSASHTERPRHHHPVTSPPGTQPPTPGGTPPTAP